MDKSDFKIALKEIPDEKWYVSHAETTMYYVYEDSFNIEKSDTESFCTLDIKVINHRFNPYLKIEMVKNFRFINHDNICNSTTLFEAEIFNPILKNKYRKIYKNIIRKRRIRDNFEKKKENMRHLPKSLIRSLNIEKYLED